LDRVVHELNEIRKEMILLKDLTPFNSKIPLYCGKLLQYYCKNLSSKWLQSPAVTVIYDRFLSRMEEYFDNKMDFGQMAYARLYKGERLVTSYLEACCLEC